MALGARLPVNVVLAYAPESALPIFRETVEEWVGDTFGLSLEESGSGAVTVDWSAPLDESIFGAQVVVADKKRGATWTAVLLEVDGESVVAVSEAPLTNADAARTVIELSVQMGALLTGLAVRAHLTLSGRDITTLSQATAIELSELLADCDHWAAPGLVLGVTKNGGGLSSTQQKVMLGLPGVVLPVEADLGTVGIIGSGLSIESVQAGCLVSVARGANGLTTQVIPAMSLQRQPEAATRLILRHQQAAPVPFSLERERALLIARIGGEGNLDDAVAMELLDDAARKQIEAERQLNDCQFELELGWLEQDDALRELEATQSRLRFLEKAFREIGQIPVGDPEPDDDWIPECCADAISGAEVLEFLSIPAGVVDGALELDQHPKKSLWGKKVWGALRALNDYALAKNADRFRGDLIKYRQDPPSEVIPLTYEYAAKESQATSSNPDLRRVRIFTVPEAVSSDRVVYMEQHVKVDRGGANAPRIHLYDDTDGATKKIHIGYVGPHLPTSSGF